MLLLILSLHLSAAQSGATLRVIDLRGAAYDRGRSHGEQLRPEISRLVHLWKIEIKRNFDTDPDQFIAAFLQATDYKPTIEKICPELLDEVRGISDGAKIPFATMYAFQLVDEIWVNGRGVRERLALEHCTSLGAPADGTNAAWIAQNVDVENFRNGFQTLLRIRGEAGRPDQYVFTFAGYIGANGLNEKGIGICANALPQLKHAPTGLPVSFVIRTLLNETNTSRAAQRLQRLPHATGQNYVLGAGRAVYDFECSAGKVTQFSPATGKLVYHTNHPLTNDNMDVDYLARVRRVDPDGRSMEGTLARLQAVQRRVVGRSGLDLTTIVQTLRSRDSEQFPICAPVKPGAGAFTFGSTIMRLWPEPELRVCAGPPDASDYTLFRFERAK